MSQLAASGSGWRSAGRGAILPIATLLLVMLMKPTSSIIAGTGTTISMTSSKVAMGRIAPRPALIQALLLAASWLIDQPPSRASII